MLGGVTRVEVIDWMNGERGAEGTSHLWGLPTARLEPDGKRFDSGGLPDDSGEGSRAVSAVTAGASARRRSDLHAARIGGAVPAIGVGSRRLLA